MIYSILFRIHEYIKFWFRSKSTKGHGIHSPFVFAFLKDLQEKVDKPDMEALLLYRKKLIKNKEVIHYNDSGAGSFIIKKNKTNVGKMAKAFSVRHREGELLYKTVRFLQPDTVFELGTALGVSTYYLALGCKASKIYTVEANKESSLVAQKQLPHRIREQITFVISNFSAFNNNLFNAITPGSILFIDGDHSYKASIDIVIHCLEHKQTPKSIILSDIYWNAEMKKAWNDIKELPFQFISIDFFHFGLIANHINAPKQHFSIRY
jgi:predicted O-methyltransferase YrrM